jgi:hypothetical protein
MVMLINSIITPSSPHYGLPSATSSKFPLSLFELQMFIVVIHTSLILVLLPMALGFNGHILVASHPLFLFYLDNNLSNVLST